MAFITKLRRQIASNENYLWANVLKAKYVRNTKPRDWKTGPNSSYIWRGIWKGKDWVTKGMKWNLGDGSNIKIWEDWWYGNPNPLNRVSDIIVNKRIDSSKISSLVSHDNIQQMLNIHVPRHAKYTDTPS